jgi:hypothetical protein
MPVASGRVSTFQMCARRSIGRRATPAGARGCTGASVEWSAEARGFVGGLGRGGGRGSGFLGGLARGVGRGSGFLGGVGRGGGRGSGFLGGLDRGGGRGPGVPRRPRRRGRGGADHDPRPDAAQVGGADDGPRRADPGSATPRTIVVPPWVVRAEAGVRHHPTRRTSGGCVPDPGAIQPLRSGGCTGAKRAPEPADPRSATPRTIVVPPWVVM